MKRAAALGEGAAARFVLVGVVSFTPAGVFWFVGKLIVFSVAGLSVLFDGFWCRVCCLSVWGRVAGACGCGGCTVYLFGLGTLTDTTKVVPERVHGVGLLTGEQRRRISGRDIAYTNIGDVAEVLRAAHDPTEEQRLLIMGRDGTCRFPDCTMDATFCDIDHVINHEVGGWTTASNLQCLCRHHHNFKTDRHATASTDTYGNVTWRFATGATITTIPQGEVS